MHKGVRILVLEDNLLDFELVSALLAEVGADYKLVHTRDKSSFESEISTGSYDLVLSDYAIPGYSGVAALSFVRAKHPLLPFIILSGTLSEEQAVEILKAGATDYIIKERLHRLAAAIERALDEAEKGAELRAHEERIRDQAALLDKARDAIVLISMEQRILYWNESAERIFGWSEQEAVGELVGNFLTGRAAGGSESVLDEVLALGEWRGELPVQTKLGKRIVVDSRWSLMRDPESPRPKSILLINTDITEKKEIEAQFLRAQRIETIGSLSGGIAHDLNNALSPIIMASELLSDEVNTDSGKRMLEMVRGSANRCAEMVKQILTFSRGAGQGTDVLDPCRIIEEITGLVRETFPRLITIESQCDLNLKGFRGNITQIHQVLMNLLVNARDAMPRGGVIRIKTKTVTLKGRASRMLEEPATGKFTTISIADTGTGIAPEIMEKIFEPFFTTKELGKGTGLGLSTVFSIVKAHRGFLEVTSEVGKGSRFDLYFPSQIEGAEAKVQSEASAPRGRGERLLVVDDETGLLAIVKSTLETLGYSVRTASDGLAALEVLEKSLGEIDLMLTDWAMPLMSGTEFIRRVRAMAPDLKIIVASGSGPLDDGDFKNMPIEGVLHKPYSTDALLGAIGEALDKPPKADAVPA